MKKIFFIILILAIVLFCLNEYTKSVILTYPPQSFIILWLAVILFFGKLAGMIERYGHPSVLGELLVGALLGNLMLLGITFFEPAKIDPTLIFLTQLGAIVLFFQAGLAIDLGSMKQFLKKALVLAILGIVFSVTAYYYLLPLLIPGHSQMVYLYMAFALSPTGAGVTARVMQDLGKIHLKASQFIISAGALDNIIAFTLQALLIAYIQTQTIQYDHAGILILKVIGLIVGIFVFGIFLLPSLTRHLADIYPSRGLKFAFVFSIGLFAAFFAQSIGISPVIGAFLAGVVINPTYFQFFTLPFSSEQAIKQTKELASEKMAQQQTNKKELAQDLQEMLSTPGFLLVCVFFVVTGMNIDMRLFVQPQFVITALIITIVAFLTKILAALVVERKIQSLTGIGMSPRGVTTLVFAAIGKRIELLNSEMVTLIILIVMLTTFLTPLILTPLFKKLRVE